MGRRSKAFSLIELVIVIAVIGAVAAILIPLLSAVVDKANQKSALSDARNALTKLSASISHGNSGYELPPFVVFVKKANKIYAVACNNKESIKLIDERGMSVGSHDTAETELADAIHDYEQQLLTDELIYKGTIAEENAFFALAKDAGLETPVRTCAALDDNRKWEAQAELVQLLGYSPDEICIALDCKPASVSDDAAVNEGMPFTINGIPFAGSMQQALDSAEENSAVVMYTDVSDPATLEISKSVTICGNGHTILGVEGRSGSDGTAIRISQSGVKLKLKDLTIEGNGTCSYGIDISNQSMTDNDAAFVYSDMELNNVSIVGFKKSAVIIGTDCLCNFTANSCVLDGGAALCIYSRNSSYHLSDCILHGTNPERHLVNGTADSGTIVIAGHMKQFIEAPFWTASHNRVQIERSCIISDVMVEDGASNGQALAAIEQSGYDRPKNNTIIVEDSDLLLHNEFMQTNNSPSNGMYAVNDRGENTIFRLKNCSINYQNIVATFEKLNPGRNRIISIK